MTSPLPATPRPRFVVCGGSGHPTSIDAYLYNGNTRIVTYRSDLNELDANGDLVHPHRDRFVALVLITATGGFGADAQADRLASGLYGGQVFDTFEAAWDHLAEMRELVLR